MKIYPRFKLWLENEEGQFLLGEGTFKLLEDIGLTGSLSEAAKKSGISYAHAWKKIRKVEKMMGKSLLVKSRGGVGGGHSTLTDDGRALLERFTDTKRIINESLIRSL